MPSKKSLPRVSIVIPAYNEERHIAACLDAIANQTSPVFEAVVVDNNCTDNTIAIAKRYPFVRVIRAAKQGIVFARNAGFDAARGDVIGRIDADIRLPAAWVERIQDFCRQPGNAHVAWTGRGHFYNVRFSRLVSLAYEVLAFGLNRLLLGHHMVWGSNMAFTPAQWQRVRTAVHTRTGIHEDLDLAIHLHEAGYGVYYDRSLQTYARLGRVREDRDKLWGYLLWWPRTLKLHGHKTWVVCWFVGAFLLYVPALFLAFADWVAKSLGKKSLPD